MFCCVLLLSKTNKHAFTDQHNSKAHWLKYHAASAHVAEMQTPARWLAPGWGTPLLVQFMAKGPTM
jgi:hypothetical protein